MFHILICLIFSLHRSKTKHIIHICLRSNNILRKYTKISTICFYANTFQLPTKVSPKPSKVFELFLYILITCDSLVIDLFQTLRFLWNFFSNCHGTKHLSIQLIGQNYFVLMSMNFLLFLYLKYFKLYELGNDTNNLNKLLTIIFTNIKIF